MFAFKNLIKLERIFDFSSILKEAAFPCAYLCIKEFHSNNILQTSRPKENKFLKNLSKQSSVTIKPIMTIKELADNLDVKADHIYECLNKINYHYKNREDYVLNNVDIIIKIVKLCGQTHRFEGNKP